VSKAAALQEAAIEVPRPTVACSDFAAVSGNLSLNAVFGFVAVKPSD
jgi:hypothetical protein